MSLFFKRKREIEERKYASGSSGNRVILKSQTKQIKSDSTQNKISTNYPCWVTTEAALKLGGPSITTQDRLAVSNHKSSSLNKSSQGKDWSKNLQTCIFHSKIQNHGDHHEEGMTHGVSLNTSNQKGTFDSLGCLEETRAQNLMIGFNEKGLHASTSHTNYNLEKEMVDYLGEIITPKNNRGIRSNLISLSTTMPPESTSNSIIFASSEVEQQVYFGDDFPSFVEDKDFILDEIHGDYLLASDNNAGEEKDSIKMTQRVLFKSKNSKIDEHDDYDEGLDDKDFLAVISCAALADGNRITAKSNVSPAVISPSFCSNLSIASNKNKIKISYLPAHIMKEEGSKQLKDDEYSSSSIFKDIASISGEPKYSESLQSSSTGKGLFQENRSSCTQGTHVASTQQIDRQASNQAQSDVKDGFDTPMLTEQDWNFLSDSDLEETDGQFNSSIASSQKNKQESEKVPANHESPLTQSKAFKNEQTDNPISSMIHSVLDDSHEYRDPGPFTRPGFPPLAENSNPIKGISSNHFLRVCFRIGEMIKEAEKFNNSKKTLLVELFARVTYSYREPGTCRQIFKFADMWHSGESFASGILANYKATDLIEQESKEFIENNPKMLARVLSVLWEDNQRPSEWLLHIVNIRKTDWEEINWTRTIVNSY